MTAPGSFKTHLVVLIVTILIFSGLCLSMAEFVLDDAFITYRYALNLATHGVLEWNLGEDPVEGYTSFLWVITNAAGIAAGFDPVPYSKSLAMLSGWLILALLAGECRNLSWPLALALLSGAALNPALALLTTQGMETTLTSALILSTGLLALKVQEKPGRGLFAALHGLTFLAFLARPDTAIFTGVMLIGLAIVFAANGRGALLKMHLATGLVLGIALALYMAWRISYFGYFFPNTYYIKSALAGSGGGPSGTAYILKFVTEFAWPYLLALVVLVIFSKDRKLLISTAPLLAGAISFGAYMTTITPIQGAAWRFILPVFPVILLLISRAAVSFLGGLNETWKPKRTQWAAIALLITFFVYWPTKDLEDSLETVHDKTQHDRVIAGHKLRGLNGTLLTSESGAVPFYSEWNSVDLLGLNSEVIAHQGLQFSFLAELNPDLVMTRFEGADGLKLRPAPAGVLMEFLASRKYAVVAVVRKNEAERHVYFANTDSLLFDEIAHRLQNLPAVAYGVIDPAQLQAGISIPAAGSADQETPQF